MLDIEFVLAQQPFAEVAVDLVNAFPQFVRGNLAEMNDLRRAVNFFFQAGGERVSVRFNQTDKSVGEHHTHPLVSNTSPALHPNLYRRILRGPTLDRNLYNFHYRFQGLRNRDGARNHANGFRAAQQLETSLTLLLGMDGQSRSNQDFVEVTTRSSTTANTAFDLHF